MVNLEELYSRLAELFEKIKYFSTTNQNPNLLDAYDDGANHEDSSSEESYEDISLLEVEADEEYEAVSYTHL